MCCLRVSGFLTEITQQIHSLRASGVISSHFARAAGSEMRIFRKSAGTPCTAPAEIAFFGIDSILHRYAIESGLLGNSRDVRENCPTTEQLPSPEKSGKLNRSMQHLLIG